MPPLSTSSASRASDPPQTVPAGVREDVDVTFFIPCLNEEKRVGPTLETVRAAMAEVNHTYEVIVVNDGSTDGTATVVEEYQRQHPELPVRLINNPRNLGLAHSFVDAAFHGRGRHFRLICGDNVEPKESMLAVLSHMGQADIVAPYYPEIPGKTGLRLLISKTYNELINLIGGYRLRYYNGNPLYLRYHIMRWAPHNFGFGYQADLLTQLLDQKATVVEIPIVGLHRDKGPSTSIRFRNFMSVAHSLLEIFIRRLRRLLFPR